MASILVGAGVIGACLIIWAYVIHTHGVDVPREDQWHVPAHQIELFLDGRLTLDDLLVQHLESRKLVPNLISVGVVYLRGHFDTHAELYVGFIVGATLVCLIGVLAWLTWRRLDYALALAALFCAVLYSGHSIRFHLFSITFERLLPELMLVLSLTFFVWRGITWPTIAAAALAACIGQYSFAGGVTVWGLILIYILLAQGRDWKRYVAKIGFFISVGVASSILYFRDYETPGNLTPWSAVLDQSVTKMFHFIFAFLENAFISPRLGVGVLGGILFLWFCVLFFLWLYKYWRSSPHKAISAWFVLGGYSISQGLLAMIGRLPMSFYAAYRPDYVSHSSYLVVAVFAITLCFTREQYRRRVSIGALAVGCVLLLTLVSPQFWQKVRLQEQRLNHGKACVLLSKFHLDETCLKILYPWPDNPSTLLPQIARLIKPSMLERLTFAGDGLGSVDQVTSKDGVLRARGWAAAGDAPAGAVVAAIGAEAGNKILGIGAVTTPREDLAEALGDHLLLSGWELEIPFTGVGDNLCDVQFFAFDNTRGLLTPLQGARPAGCESPDGKMGAYRPDHHSDRGV